MPVLISVTEDMQSPERSVPWIVRLKAVDDCLGILGNSRKPAPLAFLVFFRVTEDREFVPLMGSMAIQDNRLPYKMVEGASEVMESISENSADLYGDAGRVRIELPYLLSSFSIKLMGDKIGIRVTKDLQCLVKCVEVFACPLEFGISPLK